MDLLSRNDNDFKEDPTLKSLIKVYQQELSTASTRDAGPRQAKRNLAAMFEEQDDEEQDTD